ncbi:hypothetical protein Q9233_015427 [Columba guinea]|nr:hypothetical protein Q9233_015427 [Columba guinea]
MLVSLRFCSFYLAKILGAVKLLAGIGSAERSYPNSTGVISSLQRQLEIQESQLRRIQSEKEMLQKKLREREHQLQGLSAKFCSLTEEQEDKEMMVTIEKENCNLRQVVAEQESKLAEQRQLISELQEAVGQLQEEVRSSRYRLRQQRQARDAVQSQAEALQHQELQTRVALECLTSRFERYRNKIIQATFSTAGMKAPQAELTDEEVLEAMQVRGSCALLLAAGKGLTGEPPQHRAPPHALHLIHTPRFRK